MKKLLIIAVLAVAGVANAVQPDRTLESAGSATGQNIRIASNANATGEYGVVAGSNKDAAASTLLFAVCEDCDAVTPTYVFSVDSDGDLSFGSQIVILSTTSSAGGLNFGIASNANAAGEYGVVVGTNSTAVITGQGLFAVAADVDGTPIYSLEVQPVGVTGVGAQVLNTSSAAALNLAIYSGADAAGEYAISAGSSAIVTDGTQLFGVCSDCDGTEAYVFTVSANDNVLLGASAPLITTVSTSSGLNLGIASDASAAGEYGVVVGSTAAITDGTQLFAVANDVDGTPTYMFTVTAAGNASLGSTGAGALTAGSILPSGAAAFIVGGASTTSITLTTDASGTGEVVLPLQSIAGAEMVNDTVDGTELADSIALDVDTAFVAGAGEQRTLTKTITDAVADDGLMLNCTGLDTTAAAPTQRCLVVTNAASTEALSTVVVVDNADVDDSPVGMSFTVSGGGTFLDDMSLSGGLRIRAGSATTLTLRRTTAGVVTLLAADNDANADLTVAAGGTGALSLGSGTNTSVTIVSDGTLDGDLVLPLTSVSGAEMVADTVDGAQLADTITLDAALVVTGAFAHNYGNSLATSVTIATDATGNAELVLPGESVGAAEILDNTGRVNLGLGEWVNCTAQLPLDVSAADAEPDFAAVNTAVVIAYDAVVGTVDTQEICTSFVVPADWISGGTISVRATQGSAVVTNIEDFTCRWSIDGAAIGAVNTAPLANQVAVQTVTVTPAGTLAAGASVGVECEQSDASADDTVNFHAIWFDYTKSQ
mgnify:CR=1 FL=1